MVYSRRSQSMMNKGDQTYRIATWNLERPIKKSKRTSLIFDYLDKLDADILVLTETSNLINTRLEHGITLLQMDMIYPIIMEYI